MQRLLCLSAAVLALAAAPSAFATTHKEAPNMKAASAPAASASMTAQQARMGECNKKATGKTGDERKKFMSSCLSGDVPMSQQDKMKKCNADAGAMKGDERKAFMSNCLKA